MPASPLKVLFFAEGATLAHVARPFVLAEGLPPETFEVVFARPQGYEWLTRDARFQIVDLPCQAAAVFAQRLAQGRPLYDLATLTCYVETDRALIRQFRPDVIVGDFRLSLAVSARLEGVPYASLCDAYWSPEAPLEPPPLPVLPFTPFVPIALAERLFAWISPIAFRIHARPMELLRRSFGLPGIGPDLRLAYTDADLRLFASFPSLFPDVRTHAGAQFIGPVAWSPKMELPAGFPDEAGLIYVTMGSSGRTNVLAALFDELAQFGTPTVVATAGRKLPATPKSRNIKIFDFLPGDKVMARSRLAICNGGSPTTTQALLAGVPVLGIPSNMDQMLNMLALLRDECGLLVRADRANPTRLRNALLTFWAKQDVFRRSVARCAGSFPAQSPELRFAILLRELAGSGRHAPENFTSPKGDYPLLDNR